MGNEMNKKCKAQGCNQWVSHGNEADFCSAHQGKIDPISALYIDKTPEQQEADERIVEFFSYLLRKKTLEELMG
jgi:hypothetical protein